MDKYKILFLCVHNSARSQMAEAFLNKHGSQYFHAESAGLEPGMLNPNVVTVMKEAGIDISGNKTKDVFGFYKSSEKFDAVITVCDASNAERCPIFPGKVKRIAWYFDDPSSYIGTQEEILIKTRIIRDEIKDKVNSFIIEAKEMNFWV